MPTTPLPTARKFLSSLFESFPKDPFPLSEEPINPLQSAPPNTKSLLLTLHVLFPNELLPALDLLDRKLVTRLVLSPTPSTNSDANTTDGASIVNVNSKTRTVYYVRSSQQSRSRFSSSRTYDAFASSGQNYEVRLKAWNCSCPAFAFVSVECMVDASLGELGVQDDEERRGDIEGESVKEGARDEDGGKREDNIFGGLIRGGGEMPVCKHLLACLLAENWVGFEAFVEERAVERDEMSGWAAGWGG
ncbi:MAG: hypothetical protein Q9170_000787 [Blastenia crenularia]